MKRCNDYIRRNYSGIAHKRKLTEEEAVKFKEGWKLAMQLVQAWMRNGGGAPADLRVEEELKDE